MIRDQKSVELTLRPSRALLRWIILIHILSILAVLFLGLYLGLHTVMTAVLLLVITVGFFQGYRQYKKAPWHKIIFDGEEWGLIPSDYSFDVSAIPPVKVKLCHYYRFGNSWVLSFCGQDRTILQTLFQGRITILLLPDGCDKEGFRRAGQILMMKNRLFLDGTQRVN